MSRRRSKRQRRRDRQAREARAAALAPYIDPRVQEIAHPPELKGLVELGWLTREQALRLLELPDPGDPLEEDAG